MKSTEISSLHGPGHLVQIVLIFDAGNSFFIVECSYSINSMAKHTVSIQQNRKELQRRVTKMGCDVGIDNRKLNHNLY